MSKHNSDKSNELEQLTAEAQALATENLTKYKTKLFFYALLGYATIFGVLLLLVAIVGGLGALAVFSSALLIFMLKKKIILVLIPAIWILLKALWVKIEAPKGYTLTRSEYPQLFANIDRIRAQLKAPQVHQVLLTGELNAAVAQTPRLGVLGWYKNALILGLELLLLLSPKQAEAVLAHELGHLSVNHNRFNGWIYRLRMSWQRIMYAFQASGVHSRKVWP